MAEIIQRTTADGAVTALRLPPTATIPSWGTITGDPHVITGDGTSNTMRVLLFLARRAYQTQSVTISMQTI